MVYNLFANILRAMTFIILIRIWMQLHVWKCQRNTTFGDEEPIGKKRKLDCPEPPDPPAWLIEVDSFIAGEKKSPFQCCYSRTVGDIHNVYCTSKEVRNKCARCEHRACQLHLWLVADINDGRIDRICRHCLTDQEAWLRCLAVGNRPARINTDPPNHLLF
jgi:hypothetical protein